MTRLSKTDVKKALAALNRVRPGSKPSSSNTTRNVVIAVAVLAPVAAAGGYLLSRVLRNRKNTQDVDSGYDGLPTAIATSRIGDVPAPGTFVVTEPLPDEDAAADSDKLTDDK